LLATVSASVRTSLFPEISDLAEDGDFERIRSVLGDGIVFSGVFIIPGLFGVVAIGERILRVYRPSFGKGADILLILVLAYVADVYGTQFVSALNAIDRPDVTYRINLLFVGLNLVLNIVLIWQYGWYGAAVATAVSATVRAVLAYWSIRRSLGRPDIPFIHLGWEVVAALGMFVVVVLGGLGSVKGAILAGLLVGVVEQVSTLVIPLQLQPSIIFVLFLVVILVKPYGIFGSRHTAGGDI
jgi:O-antigen/teichoic acid export membrane protein